MIPSSACRQFPHADQPGQAGYAWRPSLSYTTQWGTILNAVRDLQRSHTRQGKHTHAVAMVAQDETAPDQEDQLRVNDIWNIVRQLPEKQRDAVLLVFGEQLSQAEAAVIIGCKEVTVSWHIHNARKSLKDLL